MKTWENYKEYIKSSDPQSGQDIADMEEQAKIISALVTQRKALGLSQRDLAALCGIPQSSVARIESFQTTPNLATFIKILRSLGMKITVS